MDEKNQRAAADLLEDKQPFAANETATAGTPLPLAALMTRRLFVRNLTQKLAEFRQSSVLDIPRVTRRVSQLQPLDPMPKLAQRRELRLGPVLIDECDPLLFDQSKLVEQLQQLPLDIRPEFIAIATGDHWLRQSSEGRCRVTDDKLTALLVTASVCLIVGDREKPGTALRAQLMAVSPAIRAGASAVKLIWLTPCPSQARGTDAILWDSPSRQPMQPDALQWLLALLAPLSVVGVGLVRDLRRLLGAATDIEIEFWGLNDVVFYKYQGWGRVQVNRRRHYLEQLDRLQVLNPELLHRCLDCIERHLQHSPQFYRAEAMLAYRQYCQRWTSKRGESLVALDHYLARIGRTVGTDHGHEFACALLEMAERIGDTCKLPETVEPAFRLAAQYWQRFAPEDPVLVTNHPLDGIAGETLSVLVCYDGHFIWLEPAAVMQATEQTDLPVLRHVAPVMASLVVKSDGAVIQMDSRRQVLPVNQRWKPDGRDLIILHGVDKALTIELSNSEKLYWAGSISQTSTGLIVQPAGVEHPLRFGPTVPNQSSLVTDQSTMAGIETLWPGPSTPEIDQHGLMVREHLLGVEQIFRYIPAGEFLMGSPHDGPERFTREQQHPVTLTRGFWLADTVCSNALWRAVTGETPGKFKGDDLPVDSVSWKEVQAFCSQLCEKAGTGGWAFALPTEAQWEYACRAGSSTPFWWGDELSSEQANFDGSEPYNGQPESEYRQTTMPVKSFAANPWGLYQMHGNVWEWCEDRFEDFGSQPVTDPVGPATGVNRVRRGGGWYSSGWWLRAASRSSVRPDRRNGYTGFRLAHPVPDTATAQSSAADRG